MSIIRREVVCSQTGDVRPTIFPTDGASLHSFNLSFFLHRIFQIQIYFVIIICRQNMYKEVENDKYGKQKEKYFNTFSFQFICKFSRASLAADRPTDGQEKSFLYWQLRSTCCQDLFGIQNTKQKKCQIQKTRI